MNNVCFCFVKSRLGVRVREVGAAALRRAEALGSQVGGRAATQPAELAEPHLGVDHGHESTVLEVRQQRIELNVASGHILTIDAGDVDFGTKVAQVATRNLRARVDLDF